MVRPAACLLNTARSLTQYWKMAASDPIQQKFDYFLILDFEATCDKGKQPVPQEIIEFPCLKVNSRSFEIESKFHQYVYPESHPQLSDFCTELTGIIQGMVNNQPNLSQTLKLFEQWLQTEGLQGPNAQFSSIFVICGDWDLKSMLPRQCNHFNMEIPEYFQHWCNLKKAFHKGTKTWPSGMMYMIKELKLTHKGRHHSGIDDTINICEILKALVREKAVLIDVTSTL